MLSEIELLYRALGEPNGLAISDPDPQRLRQALYRARRKTFDSSLDKLKIRVVGDEVWITKDA